MLAPRLKGRVVIQRPKPIQVDGQHASRHHAHQSKQIVRCEAGRVWYGCLLCEHVRAC